MLNILLGILKAAGVLLGVILAIFLILILILLLGPIGYYAGGRYREEKDVSAGISWMGFVLRGQMEYKEETGLLWAVKLFGIMLASNDEEFLRKKEEKRRRQEEIRKKREDKQIHQESFEQNAKEPVHIAEPVQQDKESVRKDSIPEAQAQQEEKTVLPEENLSSAQTYRESSDTFETQSETEHKKKSFREIIKEKMDTANNAVRSLVQKLKKIIEKIKSIPALIRRKIASIREKINRFLEIKEFFLGERNREGFEHVLKNGKKMIIHILPGKIRGNIEFGVEDPYTMGQILTVLSIFYPAYQDKLTIHPDFENPGFAGDLALKGRIIPGYLLWRILVIICNREVRRIIKEGRQLIGGKTA